MKSWSESISLSDVPRDIQLTCVMSVAEGEEEHKRRQQLQSRYEEGRQDAEAQVREELAQQRAELMEVQNGVLSSLRDTLPKVVRGSEKHLVSVALEVAQKLVSDMPISQQMVEAAIREALHQVESTVEYRVQINPQDLALLKRTQSPLLSSAKGTQPVHFESSSEVARGGCLVQTPYGVIDTQRETKMRLLKEALND